MLPSVHCATRIVAVARGYFALSWPTVSCICTVVQMRWYVPITSVKCNRIFISQTCPLRSCGPWSKLCSYKTLFYSPCPFFKSVYPGLVYAVILHHPLSAHLGEHPFPGKQKLPLQRVLLLPYGLLIPGHDKHVPTETARNDSNQTSLKGHLSTRRRSNGTRRASRISELPPPSPGGCVQPPFGWNKF